MRKRKSNRDKLDRKREIERKSREIERDEEI